MFEDNTYDTFGPLERYLAELVMADIAIGNQNPWQITSSPPSYKYIVRAIIIPV
jgi:hypothetical protein